MLFLLLKFLVVYLGWFLAGFIPANKANWRRSGIVVFLIGLPFIENFEPLPLGLPFLILVYLALGVFARHLYPGSASAVEHKSQSNFRA